MVPIVRVAGLILVVYTFALFPDRLGAYVAGNERSTSLLLGTVLFPSVVPLIIGAILFFLPATVTRMVVGVPVTEVSELERVLRPLVFVGIGLYVSIQAAVALVYYWALTAYTQEAYAVDALADPSARADLISNVVLLILGVGLTLGARGLSAVLHRLRYGT